MSKIYDRLRGGSNVFILESAFVQLRSTSLMWLNSGATLNTNGKGKVDIALCDHKRSSNLDFSTGREDQQCGEGMTLRLPQIFDTPGLPPPHSVLSSPKRSFTCPLNLTLSCEVEAVNIATVTSSAILQFSNTSLQSCFSYKIE